MNDKVEHLVLELNKKKFQACQVHPRAMCVSIEYATKMLRKAFQEGKDVMENYNKILSEISEKEESETK